MQKSAKDVDSAAWKSLQYTVTLRMHAENSFLYLLGAIGRTHVRCDYFVLVLRQKVIQRNDNVTDFHDCCNILAQGCRVVQLDAGTVNYILRKMRLRN